MRTGYSNFLGEYVPADAVDYGDCTDFQIVCPCCREPTFKTKRPAAAGEVHYLSHYPSAEAGFSDCENRVASLPREHVGASNAAARKQRLDWFMSVVPDEIFGIPMHPSLDRRAALLAQRALSVDLCDRYRHLMKQKKHDPASRHAETWKMLDETLCSMKSPFAELSPLQKTVRSRAARDVETTLYADPSAGDAFRKVFCSAVNMVSVRALGRQGWNHGSPMDRLLGEFVGAIVGRDYHRCWDYMKKTMLTRAEMADGTTQIMGDVLILEIDEEIHDALCEVDYVELMRKRQAGFRSGIAVAAVPDVEEAPAFGM